ncbi:helix-turn-helix transcriptional regulator [Luedemannella helvata]
MPRTSDPRFGERMRALLEAGGVSYRALAARTFYSRSYLHELATGRKAPTVDAAERVDEALGAGGELVALVRVVRTGDDECEALELARRVEASDVSAPTLERLETVVDELAMAYTTTLPQHLLPRLREHLGYVGQLVDARATIEQRRRLVTVGGWLSLLAATVHIDLRQDRAAEARLRTAVQLGGHAERPEILAWCLETRAWDALTGGDYARALDLSRQAQALAARGSSAHAQATAQEGRAWARMGRSAETLGALARLERQVAGMTGPERPEHHYQYDPAKAMAYTATTLAWVGDPAAVDFARAALARLLAADDGVTRPRRIASARLDLSLALLGAGRADEAATVATAAVESGRVVASNWWRAAEVLAGVAAAGADEAAGLRDAYETFRPHGNG